MSSVTISEEETYEISHLIIMEWESPSGLYARAKGSKKWEFECVRFNACQNQSRPPLKKAREEKAS